MNRSVVVYGVLLAVAMVAAYLSWTHEPTTEASERVTIDRFEPDSVASVVYEAEGTKVDVQLEEDERGRHGWVTLTRRAVEPKAGSAEDEQGAAGSAAPDADSEADAAHTTASGSPDTSDAGAPSPAESANAERDAGEPETAADRHDPGSSKRKRAEAAGRDEADSEAGSGADSEQPTDTETFKASSVLERFLEDLDPLQAVRRLPADRSKAERLYGFDEPLGTLTIESSAGTRTFTIGGYAYGRQHIYVRDGRDGTYYVVDAGVIRPLKYADSRLRERSPLGMSEREIERISLQSDGRETTLRQHNIDDPAAAYWSIVEKDEPEEDEENRTAKAWVGKLMRLQIAEYVGSERPDGAELAAVVEVVPRSDSSDTLRLFERDESDGAKRFFARSAFTRRFVELQASSASSLLADLDNLFDPDEAPDSEPSPPAPQGRGARPGDEKTETPNTRGGGRPSNESNSDEPERPIKPREAAPESPRR